MADCAWLIGPINSDSIYVSRTVPMLPRSNREKSDYAFELQMDSGTDFVMNLDFSEVSNFQINSTNLESIKQFDAVRTLTIKCSQKFGQIANPSPGLFSRLRYLDRLEIDRCRIEKLPPDLFSVKTIFRNH